MTFCEIKPGKKYYHSKAGNCRSKETGLRKKNIHTVYVLNVDLTNKKILASLNGLPAEWFEYRKYVRWTDAPPEFKA